MDIWPKYKSPLGYLAGDSKIDTYGVDHSKFSLRDEITYQMARANREEQLIKSFNRQGINKDYPQYGTNFWGGNAENNYGFGSSDISENIENITNALKNKCFGFEYNSGSTPQPSQQNNVFGQQNNAAIGQNNTLQNQTPTPWNPDIAGKPQNQTPVSWNQPKTACTGPEYDRQTQPPASTPAPAPAPNNTSPNHTTDEDLYKAMWENIKNNEDVMQHPYLDTKGLVTVGGGINVDKWDNFKKINFTVNGVPATEAEKFAAYNIMRNLSNERDEQGHPAHWNTLAEKFADYTNVRISDEYARSLSQNHMTNDLAHLRREFADFDTFPQPLKEVLLDIQYNVKDGLIERKWPNLYKAIRERNINGENGIVANVNRPDVKFKRNDWARRTAATITPW